VVIEMLWGRRVSLLLLLVMMLMLGVGVVCWRWRYEKLWEAAYDPLGASKTHESFGASNPPRYFPSGM
jgi:hypothetical protein